MSPSPSPDALLHLATLKLLSDAGFPSTSRAASLTLSSIAARYIRVLGAACADRAALAGRSKVGAGDVVEALEEYGQGVEDVEEWLVRGHAGEGGFVGTGGWEELGDRLQDGVDLPEALSELKLVRTASIISEDIGDRDEADVARGQDGEDDAMQGESGSDPRGVKEELPLPYYRFIRQQSPDMSWLPPLPGKAAPPTPALATAAALPTKVESPSTAAHALAPLVDAPKLSLVEKYRQRQPYPSSQLSQSSFSTPPPHPTPAAAPSPTSSFPLLLETYQAIAGEPSVSLAQTPFRVQAADLLRRVIAPPDIYGTSDSLSGDLPGPNLVLGPSASETLPIPTIPVNLRPRGILSQLVREMRSPYLPPNLRDRLTTLRPPTALTDDQGQSVYYGNPVRGPDEAARNKARGKPVEEGQEAFYRYTYDAGPRGVDKWGNGQLPSGKKVVQAQEGEERPRTVRGTRAVEAGGAAAAAPATGAGTIKLRLDRSPSFAQPSPASPLPSPGTSRVDKLQMGQNQVTDPDRGFQRGSPSSSNGPNGQRAISVEDGAPTAPSGANGDDPPAQGLGVPRLRISTASLSPLPPQASPEPTSATSAQGQKQRINLKPLSASPSVKDGPAASSNTGTSTRFTLSPSPRILNPDIAPPAPGPAPVQTFWQKPAPAPSAAVGQSAVGQAGGGLKLRLGVKREAQG